MHRHIRIIAVSMFLALHAGPLHAQDASAPLAPGDLVRVRRSGEMVQGRLVSLDDSLRLATADGPVALSFPGGTTLERQVPRRRAAGMVRGAGYGVLIGGLGGALVGFSMGDDPPGFMAFTAAEKAGALGVFCGALGVVAGGVAGLAAPGHTWQELNPDGLQAAVYPVEGGAAVAFTIALP